MTPGNAIAGVRCPHAICIDVGCGHSQCPTALGTSLESGMILSRSPIRISEISPSWGAANSATGLNKGLDGILGVGPVNLASDTVSNTSTVPAVLENLFAQGTIPEEVWGLCTSSQIPCLVLIGSSRSVATVIARSSKGT